MLRTFQPADKTILVKGSTAALTLAKGVRRKLERLLEPTMQIDVLIARVEDVKGWLEKNCAGDRGLLGEIEVGSEMAKTMTMCCRLHEADIQGIEGDQASLELSTDNASARLIEIRSLVARLNDQTAIELEDKPQTRPALVKTGRRERSGGQD